MDAQWLELLQGNRLTALKKELSGANAVDLAEFLETLDNDKLLLVFRILPKDVSAEVFAYMTPSQQQIIVEGISNREVRALVDDLFLDDTVDFLEEVPASVVKKVLSNTDENTRKLINQFLAYPDDSAGGLMTIEYVDLKDTYTVGRALDDIRKTGLEKETVNTCYVTDASRRLTGTVSLRRLILCQPEQAIRDIMSESHIRVNTHDDQETVADMFRKYDLTAMPVVDGEDRLVGIITVDDIIDVIEEENTEDFHKMAAIVPSTDEYMKTSVLTLAKNRILWLLVLMISASLTSTVISGFENAMEKIAVLTTFIPVLMGSGGNAGSQTTTMVIRSMALDEITPADVWRVLWKELRVALLTGGILALVNFGRVLLLNIGTAGMTPTVALVMSLSMYITVILAKMIGTLMPMAAKKLKLDPALLASPMISTIVDTTSLLVYFSLATVILGL